MSELFIPTLSFWENGNHWYGSLGQARFLIQPQEDTLTVQLWRGPLTKELSEILAEASKWRVTGAWKTSSPSRRRP